MVNKLFTAGLKSALREFGWFFDALLTDSEFYMLLNNLKITVNNIKKIINKIRRGISRL